MRSRLISAFFLALALGIVIAPLPALLPRPGATAEKTVAEIVETHGKAVLVVVNLDPGKAVRAQVSGFLVGSNGVFVTNFHVVERATAVMVKLPDGREFAVTGVVALKPDLDLAILKVEAQGLPVVTLGDSDTVKVGQRVIAIGSPLALENTVSDGLVSAIRGADPGGKLFQISSPVSPGSSGGVLLNTEGKVIGITFAQVAEGQNLNFAIPINYAKPLIRDAPTVAFSPGALIPRADDDDCPVIGNRMSGIYHVSGGQFYSQMRVSQNRVCLKSEEEAVRAGFRRSLR